MKDDKKYEIDALKEIVKQDNIRQIIIEHSIKIEELSSMTIGLVLGVKWKETKSFGYSSTALSFNQKIQIIQDLKGITKENIKKLTCLMNIRNKFAHISEIETFIDLYEKTSVGKEIKSNFKKWYLNKKIDDNLYKENMEKLSRLNFLTLTHEIIELLFSISKKHAYETGSKDGENDFKDRFIDKLTERIKNFENGKTILSEIIDSVEKSFKS